MSEEWYPKPLDKTPVHVGNRRKDGKYLATFVFSSGRNIGKLITEAELESIKTDGEHNVYFRAKRS